MSGTGTVPSQALAPGLDHDQLLALLVGRFAARRDPRDQWDLTVAVAAERIREIMVFLRDEPTLSFTCLLDITGIDYLAYPNHRDARFAIVYGLKSHAFRHRLRVKVAVEEDAAEVPSIHDLFRIADWQERETWDQYGIVFTGHPNLKRLLNHHEFIGHPLRKDYPCQKRQKLSVNDPMIDQLEDRLRQRGFTVLDRGHEDAGEAITAPRVVMAATTLVGEPASTATQAGQPRRGDRPPQGDRSHQGGEP